MKEIWKEIKNYKDYQVSSKGRIKSKSRLRYSGHKGSKARKIKEKILKSSFSWGYKRVRLYKNLKGKFFSIHRLVAETFIKNLENKPEVNHKDGNKSNNGRSNLEWATRSENQKHAFYIGLNQSGLINGIKSRFKKGQIPWNKRIDKNKVLLLKKENCSVNKIAKILNCHIGTIYYILKKEKSNENR